MPWRQTPALVQWLQGPCQKGLCRPSASRSVGMTRVGGLAMVFASKCSPGHLGQVTSSLYASAEGMTPSSDPTLKWHWWWARWSTDFRDTRTGGFPGAMFLDATIQPLGIHIQRRLPPEPRPLLAGLCPSKRAIRQDPFRQSAHWVLRTDCRRSSSGFGRKFAPVGLGLLARPVFSKMLSAQGSAMGPMDLGNDTAFPPVAREHVKMAIVLAKM